MPIFDPTLLSPMVRKLLRHSAITPEEQKALLELPVNVKTVERHCYLVREEEAGPSCIVLLDGFAYRSKIAGDGGRQILAFHMQGDMVNLHGSLSGRTGCSVQALTALRVGHVCADALMKVADTYPGIASALWRDTSIDSSVLVEWMLNIGRRDARQRIAHLICEFAQRLQAAGISCGPAYQWPLTQVDIADATGLTNVHVNRMLKDLQRSGLVQMDRGSVIIMDWAAFAKIADFDETYLHQSSCNLHIKAVGRSYDQSLASRLSTEVPRATAVAPPTHRPPQRLASANGQGRRS